MLDRTGIALLGTIAMLVIHGITIPEAARHVDYETLLLLFGLMIFSAQLHVAGFYVWTGHRLTADSPTDPNDCWRASSACPPCCRHCSLTTSSALAFTPLLCDASLNAREDPVPYLLALATSSNIGSAATIIGNPQNMYIGTVAKLPFGHFTLVMVPVVLVGLALCWVMTVLLFRRRLDATLPEGTGWQCEAERGMKSRLWRRRASPCRPRRGTQRLSHRQDADHPWGAGGLLPGHVRPGGCMAGNRRYLAGAGLLLCSRRAKAARLYHLVDWNLLLLFIGLFVVNGAMKERWLTDRLFGLVTSTGVSLDKPMPLSAITVLLSNLVSNVPAVLLLEPSLTAAGSQKLWYLLALVSTWAGNLTLVGSIANLIVAESAKAYGIEVDLKTYCILGVPLTIVCVLIGTAWIAIVM